MKAKNKLEQDEAIYRAGEKAGYDKAREEMNLQTVSLAELLLNKRQEGIREVMKFTAEEMGVDWSLEKAQLKKWGLSNE